jgi:putative peptidoglycan lipid II flippase
MAIKSIGKTVFSVTSITLLSRLLSLVSMQYYISKFGFDNVNLQIFMYALLLPNTIFTAIGTLLTTIIIPIYSSLLSKNEVDKAKDFLNNIITISSISMLILILFGIITAPIFAYVSVHHVDKSEYITAISYIRILMPVMFFYGISFIFQGILQTHHKFNIVAAITVPSSIITICYIFLLGDKFGIKGLLIFTLIALSSQTVFLLPSVLKTGYRYKFSFNLKDELVHSCFKKVLPVLVGVSSYQLNTLFNGVIATNFNIIHIQLVQNIILSSVLSFIYSVTSIYYPRLSVLWSNGNFEQYKENILNMISILLFLLIPITFGFISISYNFFDLLSNYGKVTNDDVSILGNLMSLYSVGIIAIAFKEVIDRSFYAQGNTKTSAFIGIVIMVLNCIFTILLLKKFKIYTMPISYVVSTTIGAFILISMLRVKIGKFGFPIIIFTIKCIISASTMFFVIIWVQRNLLNNDVGGSLTNKVINLVVPILIGGITYFSMVYLLKIKFIHKIKEQSQ